MKTFSRQFNSRFVTFFTGVLFALAAFFTFSCTLQNEEPKSSVGFNLQPGFLRSVAGEATGESGETGKIDLKAEISGNLTPPLNSPLEKSWTISDETIKKGGVYKIDELPCDVEINITLSILENGVVTYKSDSKTVRLAPGENQISITLKKVSSGETKEDTTESTETGDNTGKTDSGGNSGSSETGGADGQGSSGSQGASGDSGSGGTSGGQDSSGGNSDSGTSDSGTSGGSGDTSGGNSGSGGTSGDGSSTSGGGSTSGDGGTSGDTSGDSSSSGGSSGSGDTTGGNTGDGSSGSGTGGTSGGQTSSGDGGSGSSGTGDTSGDSSGSGDTSGGNSGSGDTSGDGSTGGQTSSAGTITLSAPEEKSNNSITVTATITGNENIQQVYCIKGEVEESNIESIFTDNNAFSAAQDSSDTTKWTFTIKATGEDANGTYTVAAKDSTGNVIYGAITISNFDFTAPAAVDESTITGTYDKSASTITLSWTNPTDADFDHVKITYTSTKQGTESTASTAETTTENTKDFTDIDSENSCYTFTLVTVDKAGNESASVTYKVTVNSFVKIDAKSITGSETWTPESSVFVSGRTLELSSFYICDHEVTRAEFKEIMGEDPSTADISGTEGNNPVTDVSWYAAIAYCNKLSLSEGLTACYTVEGITDWANFEYSSIPTSTDSNWDAVTCDFTKTGYRLPTEAEWEWAARGGENYTYAGSDTADDTTWHTKNSSGTTHEVKSKKANGYGIYDMCGNVTEWCWDWYIETITTDTATTGATSGTTRVIRGGSWYDNNSDCSVASRSGLSPISEYGTDVYGFRVVRNVQ